MDIWSQYVLPCLCAFAGCIGFTLVFNIHGPGKLIAGCGGALGWLVYLLAGKTILAGFFAAMAMSPFWCQCLLATVYHRESSPNNLDFSPDFLPLVHSFLFFLPWECVIML